MNICSKETSVREPGASGSAYTALQPDVSDFPDAIHAPEWVSLRWMRTVRRQDNEYDDGVSPGSRVLEDTGPSRFRDGLKALRPPRNLGQKREDGRQHSSPPTNRPLLRFQFSHCPHPQTLCKVCIFVPLWRRAYPCQNEPPVAGTSRYSRNRPTGATSMTAGRRWASRAIPPIGICRKEAAFATRGRKRRGSRQSS